MTTSPLPRRRHELPPTAGLPLRAGDLRLGPAALGQALAAQWHWPEPLLACSGSAAFMVALRTLSELQPIRRRVIVPAYTCPLVPLAVHQMGLTPVPCDLQAGSIDLDPQQLARLCDGRTLAVVPTHLAGRVADVATVAAVARQVGAFVIEDAAQALGAQVSGCSVGLRGDVAFFSLAAGKGLSIFEGGVLLARDAGLRLRLAHTATRMLPSRWGWELRRSAELLGYAALYQRRGLRWAYGVPLRRALRRGDTVAAVGDDFSLPLPMHRVGRWRQMVGTRAATRLPDFLASCAAQAQRFLPQLQAIDGVQVLQDDHGQAGTWPFFMLLLPSQRARDAALRRLWQAGLGVSRLFIHTLPDYAYLQGLLQVPAAIPNARDLAARSLTVGNSLWLQEADMAIICRELQAACR